MLIKKYFLQKTLLVATAKVQINRVSTKFCVITDVGTDHIRQREGVEGAEGRMMK